MRQQHASLLGLVVGVVLGVVACDAPTHPRRFSETIFNNACHFNFDCCLPAERAAAGLLALGGSAVSEEACREELHERLGGTFAVIAQAVDDGTAIYDAEAGARCTNEMQTAYDTCDSQTLLGNVRTDLTQLLLMFDGSDPECVALAARGYTRGTVDDGGACSSDVECADFGSCVFDGDDPDDGDDDAVSPVGKGTCAAPAGEGDDCSEKRCGVGLACNSDDEGNRRCATRPQRALGEGCFSDNECASEFCESTDGTCAISGTSCRFDSECASIFGSCIDDLCDDGTTACDVDDDCPDDNLCEGASSVCAEQAERSIEICDGT